jgi:isoleucyl-tRNA synthetase
LITSAARVTAVEEQDDRQIVVTPSSHSKCGRCWHWRPDVGINADHPSICGRCVSNLFGVGEPREFA